MGSRPRPTAPRLRLALLAALLVLGGCGGQGVIRASSGGPPLLGAPPPGTAASGGFVSVNYAGASAAGALLAIGLLGAALESGYEPVPQPDPRRTINVQDCTRPIENPTANLMCR